MKHLPLFISAVAATMFGSAFAYTVSGSVSDENGQAIKDASVTLVKENKTTKTDEAGKFLLAERQRTRTGQDF
ncbi:carboxypeptidase-like regulatory domain-containing protein [Fibrobacter succinogenes]|uniref:carboxypeptidase-like regulatory domain-containing protein n=1 Tax=Fibrobacter succinogenes TaxID=833 RepID=UPI0026F313E3|nr:carboxypeptidase-like regulatory domain-containing protein [Fibrobacter succinogenes]